MKAELALAATAALCIAGGCIQVKTESEIKPIHITMDVNLKVDKDLDKAFADENQQKPKGDFKAPALRTARCSRSAPARLTTTAS